MRAYLSYLFAATLLLTGCPEPAKQADTAPPTQPKAQVARREIVVWADPVVAHALTEIAATYEKQTGARYKVAAVERAGRQAWSNGTAAPDRGEPDVIAFAGRDEYVELLGDQKIDEASARTFAGDRLVVLKPQGTTYTIHNLHDIYKLKFKQLAVGDPQATTVGLYAHQALVSDGVETKIKARLKVTTNSTELPSLAAAEDQQTIAIGFASQAPGAKGIETGLLIDISLHEPLQYKAAAVAGKSNDPDVMAFLQWLAEDEATQQLLEGYGLLDRASALGLDAPAPKGTANPANQ